MKHIKGILCGDASVGKSAIIRSLSGLEFIQDSRSTIAGAFFSKNFKINNEDFVIEIWDTAGSEKYHSVIPQFFRNANVICLVFDVTNRESYNNLNFWINFAEMNAPLNVTIIVVGNKIDLDENRVISFEEGKRFNNSINGLAYLETSAKTGEGIDNLINLISTLNGQIFKFNNYNNEKLKKCSC